MGPSTRLEVAICCMSQSRVRQGGDALWISVAAVMKLLRRCFALRVAVCLICRKPALLLGQLLVPLSDASFVAGAIVVRWGCPSRAMRDSSSGVERLRKKMSLRRMLFSFGSPGRPLESFCFGDANGRPAFKGPNARPLGLLLVLHGHIETFSKVPKRLYRLFDAPVNLEPFSSGCRRAAAFVTRMGNFVQFWSDLNLVIFRVL
ncbi:hypothetical protein CRG98_036126 [Punica granatum]|uniref:Uncharacterized protein n=1 Tax=Punica granatum TaxID=22663 RepID=A0A2I0IHJ9_PUNGR|nr:hypothetical protein CRG98_036126 [Punica granatum]